MNFDKARTLAEKIVGRNVLMGAGSNVFMQYLRVKTRVVSKTLDENNTIEVFSVQVQDEGTDEWYTWNEQTDKIENKKK